MIVITTPTGTIGQQVLEKLLNSGETIRVIARDPSRLPAHTRERVEVVQGSEAAVVLNNMKTMVGMTRKDAPTSAGAPDQLRLMNRLYLTAVLTPARRPSPPA